MIDLAITNSGDLKERESEVLAKAKLQWTFSDYPVLRLKFRTGRNATDPPKLENGITLSFYLGEKTHANQIDSALDKEELRQRIMILLRINEQVIAKRHLDILAKETIDGIHDAVLDVVSPFLENPGVTVKKRELNDSPFSWQNLDIYIYDGKEEIYNFTMEA